RKGENQFSTSHGTPEKRSSIGTGYTTTLLPLLLLALPIAVQAQEFFYSANNGVITITGYNGSGGDVNIPSTLSGLPVTSIGDGAFTSKNSITGVTIPDTVTSIGISSFG